MMSFKCISYDLNLTWWRLKEPLELNKPETGRSILLPQRYETDFKCCICHYCFPSFLSNLHALDSFHRSPQEAEEAYKLFACVIVGVWFEIYSRKTCGFVWTKRLILCDEF